MSIRERVRWLFRFFLLLTVLFAVMVLSAVTTIRLIIHGRQETMPDLVGVELNTAERIANGLGLELKVEDKLFSAQYPANAIVSQIPLPGTRIKGGQSIHVLVSLGPPRVEVPNLVGSSVRAARIMVLQRGLTVGHVAAVRTAAADAEVVMAQEPPPASSEVRSPVVNLLVSAGRPQEGSLCPSFVGRQLREARDVLSRAGFKLGEVTPIPTDAVPAGVILNQSPPPGTKIGRETAFSFQVAQ